MIGKMFYTMAQTKDVLGLTETEVMQLAREGQLRDFRDGPRVMFKAEQVDSLASTPLSSKPMTAKEAKKLTENAINVQNGVLRRELDRILKEIVTAANQGLTSANANFKVFGEQQKAVIKELESLGYRVEYQAGSFSEGSWWQVSW